MSRWTPFPDLDAILDDLCVAVHEILGDAFIGMYLQGSFALGAGDKQSDADFLVVVEEAPSGAAEVGLRQLHEEIPTRPGLWNMNLEGSYADASSLRSPSGLGVPWLFNNRGHRTLAWDTHCNSLPTRWILRNHGIALAGTPIDSLVDEVPEASLKDAARADLSGTLDEIETWADMNNAWTQKYIVQTYSRLLYTATTGLVASKPQALSWAMETLDPEWRLLLVQVAEDRRLPWQPVDPPRPGSMERAKEYAQHVQQLIARRG
jgi:hypothetical protein